MTVVAKNTLDRVRYSNFGSREEAIYKLLKDIERFKVHLPEDFDASELHQGYGYFVCQLVNDLTNRELIRRQFTFEQPSFHKMRDAYGRDEDDEEEENNG